MKDNKAEVALWVQKADRTTRNGLADVLAKMTTSTRGDRSYSADVLMEAWSLKSS